jgi:hypothetical protein
MVLYSRKNLSGHYKRWGRGIEERELFTPVKAKSDLRPLHYQVKASDFLKMGNCFKHSLIPNYRRKQELVVLGLASQSSLPYIYEKGLPNI